MSTQKLLIIVLVVLVVIFVITVGVGGCHGGGDTDDAGAVRALKGLQGNRFLEIGDKATTTCTLGQDTLRRQTLTVSGSCDVKFEKRAFFRRSTRVAFRRCTNPPECEPSPFPPLFLVSVKPKDGPEQNDQIGGEACYGTSIGRAGGTMTLIGSAIIVLLRQGCPE